MIYVATVEGHHTDFTKQTLQIDLGSLTLKMSPMGDLLGYFYGPFKSSPSLRIWYGLQNHCRTGIKVNLRMDTILTPLNEHLVPWQKKSDSSY